MGAVVKEIIPGSPAARSIIIPGDILRKINGNAIGDVLDYKYYSYESSLFIELLSAQGKLKLVRLNKAEGADIGLEFDTFLMDSERSCANKCIFCFIDQNPPGCRKALYYKDDDVRLSFLQGNYVTLTNLGKHDVARIIKLRLGPINVSVHTLNPGLRSFMLGNKRAADGIEILESFARAGIMMNCQIVCCPGVNDGAELRRTMEEFTKLGHAVNSVSIVPVGLTKYRENLAELTPFNPEIARETIEIVEDFSEKCLKKRGSRVFFCADELYIKAGRELPPDELYEDYPQLQNGVGMMRLFITEFEDVLKNQKKLPVKPFSIATGKIAAGYLTSLLKTASEKFGEITGSIYEIKNDFFGENITVSGLVTGGDIVKQLAGKELHARLLIPRNMLKHGEDVFLDDMTVMQVAEKLGVPVIVVEQNGADFLRVIIGQC